MSQFNLDWLQPYSTVMAVAALLGLMIISVMNTPYVSWRRLCPAIGVFGVGSGAAFILYEIWLGFAPTVVETCFFAALALWFVCRELHPRDHPGGAFDQSAKVDLQEEISQPFWSP